MTEANTEPPTRVATSEGLGLEPERAAFEAWQSDDGRWPAAVERHGEGYKLAATHAAWTAWLAGWVRARNAERERCAKLCEDLETSVWRTYKNSGAANQHTEGRSDGAGECAALIRGA